MFKYFLAIKLFMNSFNEGCGTLTDEGGRHKKALVINKDSRETFDGHYAEYIEPLLL